MNLPEPIALPDGYTQRDWTADDIAVVAALDALVFGPDAWSAPIFDSEYHASTAAHPHSYYQVITHHDVVVGFAGLMYGPPFADITTIGVHPEHKGKKLGVALLIWLMDTARELGAEDLLLEVRADNTVAQRLYANNGFEHIHTRPRYYPGGIDAWVMRKRLRDPGPSSAVALTNKE
ncbi:MAG: ribosomal protein S18-alanine N-acetyltransferase [Micrococcaceae bacterium]|nr:ribosomal protein S18-alanine N-acetyltransferase [Micrococcaceae bacterium]